MIVPTLPLSDPIAMQKVFRATPPHYKHEFDELARATWRQRVKSGGEDTTPEPPEYEKFCLALVAGELDDGMSEFRNRLDYVCDLCDPDEVPGAVDDKIRLTVDMEGHCTEFYIESNGVRIDLDPVPAAFHYRLIFAIRLRDIHYSWTEANHIDSDIKHPISPLIEAWFRRPTCVEPTRSQTGILPNSLKGVRGIIYTPTPSIESPQLGSHQDEPATLPTLPGNEGAIVPTAMVQTWTAGGGPVRTRGRGAPLSKRIFYEVLTELSHSARQVRGPRRLPMTLRDLRDWLYPRRHGNRSYFNPKRDLPRIIAALKEVDQMRVRMTLPGHQVPTLWRPVSVTAFPEPYLDSPVVFGIDLPDGSEGGACIDRYAMRLYGLVSAPQHSACLGLAYYWDKYGTHRKGSRPIQAKRPRILKNRDGFPLDSDGRVVVDKHQKPISGYSDNRLIFLDEAGHHVQAGTLSERRRLAARERNPAVNRYPLLHSNELITLFYPEDAVDLSADLRRQRAKRSRESLSRMALDKYCVIEQEGKGLRILPTDWASFKPR